MPIKMDFDKRKEYGREFIGQVVEIAQSRSQWLEGVRMGRSVYFATGEFMQEFWPNTPRLHFGLMQEKVDSVVPRAVQAFWGMDRPVRMEKVGEIYEPDKDRAREDYVNWYVRNGIPDFFEFWENWTKNAVMDGVSVAKVTYEREWRNTCDVRYVKRMWQKGERTLRGDVAQEDTPKTQEDVIDEIFGMRNVVEATQTKADEWRVTFREDRRLFEDKRLTFEEGEYDDEWKVCTFREILVEERACPEVIEPEDFFISYRAKNAQKADLVAHQWWATKEYILKKVKDGKWQMTEDELAVIRTGVSEVMEEDYETESEDFKTFRDEIQGVLDSQQMAPFRNGKFRILEVYVSKDIDGDDLREELMFQTVCATGTTVFAEYLDVEFPHKQRPFPTLHYKPNSSMFYSPGLCQELLMLNLQLNVTMNQINENQAFVTRPFFFYEPTSMMVDPKVLEDIRPGQGIPVNNPGSVVIPNWSQTPLADMSLANTISMWADRTSGISPLLEGSTQYRGNPRTARGTLSLISEANIKLDHFLKRAKRTGWADLLSQIVALESHFGPEERQYRVTGEPGLFKIPVEELRGNMRWYFDGDTVNTNKQAMQLIAQQRYATLAPDPLYQIDMAARKALVDSVVDALSEGVNTKALKPNIPGLGGTHPPMDQKSENEAMRNGIWIDVLATDNHAEHLMDIQKTQAASEFDMWSESSVSMLGAHANMHIQALQQQFARQNAQSQVPPGQGNNASQNDFTTASNVGQSTDLGNLEGGAT